MGKTKRSPRNNLDGTEVFICKNGIVKKVSDNKSFWKSVKPPFLSKGLNSDNILLVEGNEIVNGDGKIATIMNRYFMLPKTHM